MLLGTRQYKFQPPTPTLSDTIIIIIMKSYMKYTIKTRKKDNKNIDIKKS